MGKAKYNLLLADDDEDDCIFFREAVEEMFDDVILHTVRNGEELMNNLKSHPGPLPDLLFLDLNMPRKGGFECLEEIKKDPGLKLLPVIIYSTSLNMDVVNLLYDKGARHYIRKPGDFLKLKKLIHEALRISLHENYIQPSRDKFILNT